MDEQFEQLCKKECRSHMG